VACGGQFIPWRGYGQLKNIPRMADFTVWVTACETAFWEPGTFMKAYADNIARAVETILHHNTVATAVRGFMALQSPETTWAGTATDLLELLGKVVGEKATKSKFWPIDGARLSGRLRRAATFLRKIGIEINLDEREGHQWTRKITITVLPEASVTLVADDQRPARANANGSGDSTIANDAARIVSDDVIGQLAEVYRNKAEQDHKTNGAVDFAAMDDWFCSQLAQIGEPHAETVLARVKKMLSA
jgi:hypothetical protein